MSQEVELNEVESVHPQVAMKALWLNDARQMMRLRRIHLAQEWNIPLSMISDPSAPPVQVSQNQTLPPPQNPSVLPKVALAAALACGTGGLGIGLLNYLNPGSVTEKVIDNTVDKGYDVKAEYQPE